MYCYRYKMLKRTFRLLCALPEGILVDVIISYYIEQEKHDILDVNEAWFYFDQPTLS